jgi:hypothetical protein
MSFQPGKWPDRACLAKVTANYFAALVAHDSSATQVRPPQSGLMKRLLCAASATLLLAGCSPPPTPNVNPAPAKLLRVYGTADPSLKIKVGTRYITTAQKCAQRTHSLSRNSVPLSKVVESTVDRSGVNYEATVSIDHFERGECGWRAYAIAIRASTGDGLSSGFPAADARDTGPIHSSEYKVWISDPAPGDPNAPESRQGTSAIRTLDLKCRQIVIRGIKGLSCIEDSPGPLALISEEATQVRVDFQDLTMDGPHEP